MSVHEALDDAARILDESIAQPRPRYFAFIGSSGLEIGAIADLLAHTYDINLAVDARAATQIENQAVRWVSEFVGFPATIGAFTSGGTISNVTALAAAREQALPGARTEGLSGRRLAIYCSAEVHYSITRAVELLGIGSNNLRDLPIDGSRRLRPDALAEAIDRDVAAGITPVAVVATAGTTLTGAIDPDRPDRGRLRRTRRVAPRGRCVRHAGRVGPDPRRSLPGLERADSVSVDAHKWLYLPKACGVVLVREHGALTRAFAHEQGYLPHQQHELHAVDITLEYSRPFRALKLWLAFRRTARRSSARRSRRTSARPTCSTARPPPPMTSRRWPSRRSSRSCPSATRRPASPISTRTTTRSRRRSRRTDACTSPRRSSTARCGCGRASSTSARPRTTCSRSSTSPASWGSGSPRRGPGVTDELLPAERKVLDALGDRSLDFRAMWAVSNLFRASAAIRRHMEANVLAADRLSWTAFTGLWVLWVWGEMESREFAQAVGVSRPTATGVVTTLEGRGFVRRKKDARDGRMVLVSLTAAGRRKIEQLFPTFNAEEVVVTAHLDAGEQDALARLLRSMYRAVDRNDD